MEGNMRENDIDLERAISDPQYRRKVIEQLKAEAAASEDRDGAAEAPTALVSEPD